MKKLGVALLAVAFSLPIFAAAKGSQAQTSTTPQTQTKTKKKTVRRHRTHHSKKNVPAATPATK
jgi:hypothetical protein